jgi:hypothetical protein
MPRRTPHGLVPLVDDDDDECKVECPECEGSGRGEGCAYDQDGDAYRPDCPVCCGHGFLDW